MRARKICPFCQAGPLTASGPSDRVSAVSSNDVEQTLPGSFGPPLFPVCFPRGVSASNDDRPPVAVAAQWVSQITGIGLEIVVPMLVGRWLDQRWGTSYWTVIGVVLGPLLGFWHLFRLTGVIGGTKANSDQKDEK